MSYEPIGVFQSKNKKPYQALRQGVLSGSEEAVVRLHSPITLPCLEDLEGFERIWLIYDFHLNTTWKEKVRPPRGAAKKRGVLATRSPYRPNSIGISCVKLERVQGLKLYVSEHDLLDGTPILDIKPYLPYADSFPNSKFGWIEGQKKYQVKIPSIVEERIIWLEENSNLNVRQILIAQLEYEPTNRKTKRVKVYSDGYMFSLQAWRFTFVVDEDCVNVLDVFSGYTEKDLASASDPYNDKDLHRDWLKTYTH